MIARHFPKGCSKCGASVSSLEHYDDDSIWCRDCNGSWSSAAKFDADHIAHALSKSAKPNDWIENDLRDQLNELVKRSKLDVYNEIKDIAERTLEEDNSPETGRMLMGILKWAENKAHDHQPTRKDKF